MTRSPAPVLLVSAALLSCGGCWVLAGLEDRRVAETGGDGGAPAEPTTGGATATSTSAASTAQASQSASQSVSQGSSGGDPDADTSCPSVFVRSVGADCATCLEASCCAALRACRDDAACVSCVAPTSGEACGDPESHADLRQCVVDHCEDECVPPPTGNAPSPACDAISSPSAGVCVTETSFRGRVNCNPISNVPCQTAAGEACAFDEGLGAWECRAHGHVRPVCETCGLLGGECEPGHACLEGRCYRYCCNSDDCGTGSCVYFPPSLVNVCIDP